MNKTNKVTKIEDSVSDPTYNGCFNFADGASQSNEYTYDQNGNLTKDLNKKISSIQYNLLSSGDWEMSRVTIWRPFSIPRSAMNCFQRTPTQSHQPFL